MSIEKLAPKTQPANVIRWNPRVLSKTERERCQKLGHAWQPLPLLINRLRVVVKPGPQVHHPHPLSDLVAITALVNSSQVELLIARSDINLLARKIEPNLARLDVKDEALASLLDWITRIEPPASEGQIEDYSSVDVSFLASKAADTNEAEIFFAISKDKMLFQIGVRQLPTALLDEMPAFWPIEQRHYRFARFTVEISRGFAFLTAAEIRSLCIGDVIVMDITPDEIGSRFILAGSSAYLWTGEHGKITKIHLPSNARPLMSDDFDDFNYEDDLGPLEAPDAVTTKVAFLAGVTQVSFNELQSADAGYIFKIGREPGVVDIIVGGKKIGVGELVQTSEGAGVRIMRIIET